MELSTSRNERGEFKLDLSLYSAIPSQTSELDRTGLLALQNAVRTSMGTYCYLEIGSHLGGTLQPHLLDPLCETIYSIDKRPLFQPDNRGWNAFYEGNSTARMLANLKAVDANAISKIKTIDKDASEVKPDEIVLKPDLCFIDGEHTDRAALADFEFCLSVTKPNGVIAFHDANIVPRALTKILDRLQVEKRVYRSYLLADVVFVIELGDSDCQAHAAVQSLLTQNSPTALTHLMNHLEAQEALRSKCVNIALRIERIPYRIRRILSRVRS